MSLGEKIVVAPHGSARLAGHVEHVPPRFGHSTLCPDGRTRADSALLKPPTLCVMNFH